MKTNLIFKALAHPHRRQIFHVLVVGGALSISAISSKFDFTRQGVTKHINVLEEAGMITINASGRNRFCEAKTDSLDEIQDWLSFYTKFWSGKLDNLESFLSKESDT